MGADFSIIGKRFGRLLVMELDHVGKRGETWWKCKCDCGNDKIICRGGLTSGDNISCGCYHKEHNHEFNKKHGLTSHPLYTIWSGMVQRCHNKNASNYYRYGGKGISVCSEWKNDFKKFYDWAIGNGYAEGLSIDRKDNSKGYCPENCRWSNIQEQANNRTNNRYVTFNGVTHTLSEWSRITKVNIETLRYRINHNNFTDFESLPHSELITR